MMERRIVRHACQASDTKLFPKKQKLSSTLFASHFLRESMIRRGRRPVKTRDALKKKRNVNREKRK